MDEILFFGSFDVVVVLVDVAFVMFVVEFSQEIGEGVFDWFRGVFKANVREFLDKFSDVVGGAGQSSVGKVVDTVAEGVALDFGMDGKGTMFFIIVKLHLGSIEAGLAVDEITDSGVFDDHFGPKGVTGKTEEIIAFVSANFNDDVSPAGEDVVGA